jgi:hypothetical protein
MRLASEPLSLVEITAAAPIVSWRLVLVIDPGRAIDQRKAGTLNGDLRPTGGSGARPR